MKLTADELLAYATEFNFHPQGASAGDIDVDYFAITVARRSPGRFAVLHMSQCWDGTEWVHESLPSNRTDEFKEKARFPLEEAVTLASALSNSVKLNGKTLEEWSSFRAEREAKTSS
ncbi:hypothetical protein [Glutamicibacter arilaitensis]|uniref:hypothetical protein n=1 Tax=Glutamicibacter arilaitensis TaxID=256701 RepID=UPI00384D80BF